MVSLCTAIVKSDTNFVSILIDSAVRYCPLIKQVFVADLFTEHTYEMHYVVQGLPVYQFSVQVPVEVDGIPMPQATHEYGHALGLHAAIERSREEYVLMSDPDLFFMFDVTGFYLECMEQHNLNIVGACNDIWEQQCYDKFPCIINCMVRRLNLPGPESIPNLRYRASLFLEERDENSLPPATGKYLLPGAIPEIAGQFPKPKAHFDAGCNLWWWNGQRRWLSFGHESRTYNSSITYSNFDMPSLPSHKLYFHLRGGSSHHKHLYPDYRRQYESTLLS